MDDAKSVSELIALNDGVIDLMPSTMAKVTQLDAEYHASVKEEWIELNQVDTERNQRFHAAALAQLAVGLDEHAVILELGSGVGYDTRKFLETGAPFGCYIVSEISPALLEYSRRQLSSIAGGKTLVFCCLDANQIRLTSGQVDRVLAVAAAHHFPDLQQALDEIDRVTRPGARIVFAVEPNRLWSSVMVALRPAYRRLFSSKSHSAADEEAEGFSLELLKRMGEQRNWRLVSITPVWFFTGFMHNGLEFLFRALRLKKRLRVPIFVEKLFLAADTVFFRVPFCARLAWHYTVVYHK
jgi:SAM-dependent methyltransferase